ncbi:protein MIS12 homolog [Hibiscus syriacus]|uniref:protein MIS12 homolog n=1 Tax=Hibiscus syriacus TaxID=106335 RepID=UPI001920C0DE|nr:protein MIS12 homolog [Hibiscus syriacus]
MEGSESEAIFDSLNLNPQLFINETLNTVDDLLNDAFDFYLQEASKLLKTDGSDRSHDLTKGINYICNMIQSSLDKRLAMWEYCLRHCFMIPEGFSLPKNVGGETAVNLKNLKYSLFQEGILLDLLMRHCKYMKTPLCMTCFKVI